MRQTCMGMYAHTQEKTFAVVINEKSSIHA